MAVARAARSTRPIEAAEIPPARRVTVARRAVRPLVARETLTKALAVAGAVAVASRQRRAKSASRTIEIRLALIAVRAHPASGASAGACRIASAMAAAGGGTQAKGTARVIVVVHCASAAVRARVSGVTVTSSIVIDGPMSVARAGIRELAGRPSVAGEAITEAVAKNAMVARSASTTDPAGADRTEQTTRSVVARWAGAAGPGKDLLGVPANPSRGKEAAVRSGNGDVTAIARRTTTRRIRAGVRHRRARRAVTRTTEVRREATLRVRRSRRSEHDCEAGGDEYPRDPHPNR